VRTRSRNPLTTTTSNCNVTTVTTIDATGVQSKTVSVQSVSYTNHEHNESIVDQIPIRPEVYVDPKTGRWRRIRYPRFADAYSGLSGLGAQRSFRPVNPCTHIKVVTKPYGSGDFVVVAGTHSTGPARTIERTRTYRDAFSWLKNRALVTGDIDAAFSSASKRFTASNYRKVDWFALMDKFDQAMTEFIPSSFLIGEDIYENDIFVDAFKIVLNPTNAVKILLRDAEKFFSRKVLGRMTLGELKHSSLALAKKGVNADLFYKFGVRPALRDIRDALGAHSKVSSRMNFLRQSGGSWVPIRVMQDIPADIVNTPPAQLTPGTTSQLFLQCARKHTLGVISAWGRVRKDLDWNDTWSAYLQYFGIDHIVGLAWELIPFSFCVDWFTNVKSRIDYYTRLRTGGPFAGIRNICASEKTEQVLNLFVNPGYDPSDQMQISNPLSPVHCGSQTSVNYSRYNSIPSTSGVVDLSTLGLFHGVTAGELIFQRHS
jgi:hypothetical protein